MTSQLLDNPHFLKLQQLLYSFGERLSQLPLDVWRNLVILVALIWACRSAAALFWVVFPVPDVPSPPHVAEPIRMEVKGSAAQSLNMGALSSANLFGKLSKESEQVANKTPQTQTLDVGPTKETRLNLKLQGILASSDPDSAWAIIASGNSQALYKVGDPLKNAGVKLAKVEEQRVILNNNGVFESLWLYSEEDFKKSKSLAKKEIRVPSRPQAQSAQAPKANVAASRAPRGRTAPYDNTVSRKLKQDRLPKSVGDVVRFSVHREGGKMVGYRIRPGRDRELFEEAGLKNNDIVTAVNGIAVDDPRKLREIYQNLKTATSAQLEVQRDGQPYSINISLDNG